MALSEMSTNTFVNRFCFYVFYPLNLLHNNPILLLGNIQLRVAEPRYNIRHHIIQRVALLRQLLEEYPGHGADARVWVCAAESHVGDLTLHADHLVEN